MRKRKHMDKKDILVIFFLCLTVIGFVGLFVIFYGYNTQENSDVIQSGSADENTQQSSGDNVSRPESESSKIEDSSKSDEKNLSVIENMRPTVVIRMVGDNLIHEPVANSGLKPDGTYNFDHLYKNIKDDIESADLAIINQETILGGTEMGILGYPKFNSPQEIGDAIANAGFDIVQHANNHAMDQEEIGMIRTMDFWSKYPDITVVGVSMSEEERNIPKIVEVNDIKIAVLSYTISLNGLPLPSGKPWMVHMLNYDAVVHDIKQAESMSDFVIVLPHWGVEYSHTQSTEQERVAELMVDAGADLIIGTHPHVLQPIKWIDREDDSQSLVYYSLGNYVSNQSIPARMLGGMAEITIEQQDDGVKIVDAGIVPLVTHYEWGNLAESYGVVKLEDYTDDLARKNGVLLEEFDSDGIKIEKVFNVKWLKSLTKEVLGQWYKEPIDND